jgi:hypothetical protein
MQQYQYRHSGHALSVCNLNLTDGGTAEWLPTNIDGCILWFRSDLGITKDGDNLVSAWVDQSGSGHNASAAGSVRPTYTGNQLNGQPAIIFDGSDDCMNLVALDAMASYTIAIIPKYDNVDALYGLLQDAASWRDALYTNGQDITIDDGAGVVAITAPSALTNYTLLTAIRSTITGTVYQNGSLAGTDNDPLMVQTVAINKLGFAGAGGVFPGGIVELIIYNSALSDTNRLLVENYLNARYAIY